MVSVEHMREKLSQWNPSWNINRFTDQQLMAIYNKETIRMAEAITKMYSENSPNS